jgi:nucleoside-diphosphate-sugar epimerase
MARVLVAGGAGFIGSHLVDALLARGDEVVAVDNLATGRVENLADALAAGATFVEHDVVRPLPDLGRFDAVLDLACPASPDDFARMPLEILDVSSRGTWQLLDLAHAQRARFLMASTSEIYGDPLVHPQPESYWGNADPNGPRSCYDEGKRFAEALCFAHHRTKGTDIRIVRIFNTYGERMRPEDGRVVTNFVVQALRGQPITVFGDGTQTRSFCYVADEVAGLLALLDGDVIGPVNVGDPSELTMLELAELVKQAVGSDSPVELHPLPYERTGDPARRRPDITLARTRLGWEPRTPFVEGLARTAAWIADQLGIPFTPAR